MHDMDRTATEWETNGYEVEQYEFMDESAMYGEADTEGVFDEADEMELAASLLEITDEQELDQFIGDLLKKAKKAVGGIIRSPVGQAIGGMLKKAARKALPAVGSAIGGRFGNAQLGSQLATQAGQLFGLELEGMSAEDQEFEVARQFVRFAGEAVKNAAQARGQSPQDTARNAVITAAQQFAPGLLRETGQVSPGPRGASSNGTPAKQSGRWVRSGSQIILYGIG